jgi:poly(A) polymerase
VGNGSEFAVQLGVDAARTLRAAGYEAWFVGGCVRDRLLGRALGDVDLCTNARPERLLALFPGSGLIGASFGVVQVRGRGAEIEVATYRSDAGSADGRHPDAVHYEDDVRADLRRRDFTINALIEDPLTRVVTDHVGGRADLDAGLIRAIGEPARRLAEDHLRLLRAVRFAARLGFTIEPRTLDAMRAAAASIERIAAERVYAELTRILTEGGARRGLELLDSTGLLEHVLPEVARMKGVAQPPEFHPEGDVWTHTLLVLDALETPCPPALAWAALLHDVGKPETLRVSDRIRFHGHAEAGALRAREILTRLRASRALIDAVASHIGAHMRFQDVSKMGEAAFRRFLRLPGFDELLALHRADRLGSLQDLAAYELVVRRRAALTPEQIRPRPLLTGSDLQRLGYPPGPSMGEMLRALEEEQLEGHLRSAAEAQAWFMEHYPLPR